MHVKWMYSKFTIKLLEKLELDPILIKNFSNLTKTFKLRCQENLNTAPHPIVTQS